MESRIITAVALTKYYGKSEKPSIDNINLTIFKGEKFGVFGPNGAGKTTLISLLCNIIKATSGTIEYTFDNQKKNIKEKLNQVGFVPQDFAFYIELTAKQNLYYFGGVYGMSSNIVKEQTANLLEILGLTSVADKKVKSYSGGMKRRLNLAIGLIHSPDIIFLDEPTVGVDVHSKLTIINHLEELNKKGVTIIYTSHHLKEAEDFCSRVALMDNGKVIALDTVSELIKINNAANLEELMIILTGKELRD